MTDFSVNLVLNQPPSPAQQYSRSKDQDGAEYREEPCAGTAGAGKGGAGSVADNDCELIVFKKQQIARITN